MNTAQIVYVIGLAGVFAFRGPNPAAWVLLANLAATLAACLAMDLGRLDRDAATLTMMIIDLASAAALLSMPGLPRVVAAFYAITIPAYSLNILFGVQIGTTFAIVNAVAFFQLAVAGLGGSGDDPGHRGRSADVADPVLLSGGNHGLDQGAMVLRAEMVSENSGWVNGKR